MRRTDGPPVRTGDLLKSYDGPATPSASGIAAYMLWDHARLASMFERAVERAKAGQWDSARTACALYAEGLRRHVRIEEEILFPMVERKYTNGNPRVTTPLRLQHRRIPGLIEQFAKALWTESGAAVLQAGGDLASLLLEHEQIEEQAIFPECDQLVAPEESAALVQRMHDIVAEPGGE